MSRDRYRVVVVAPEHAERLAALFERVELPCYCRYWHFGGDKHAWLARSRFEPQVSRDEMLAALRARSDQVLGTIALDPDDDVIGWLKLAPVTSLQKLYDQRLYRGLPCLSGDRTGIYAVGCMLVDPNWRRQGVSRKLLEAAIALARELGARAIEAFPRRSDGMRAEELWTGSADVFIDAGFEEIHELGPYPVLKKVLR